MTKHSRAMSCGYATKSLADRERSGGTQSVIDPFEAFAEHVLEEIMQRTRYNHMTRDQIADAIENFVLKDDYRAIEIAKTREWWVRMEGLVRRPHLEFLAEGETMTIIGHSATGKAQIAVIDGPQTMHQCAQSLYEVDIPTGALVLKDGKWVDETEIVLRCLILDDIKDWMDDYPMSDAQKHGGRWGGEPDWDILFNNTFFLAYRDDMTDEPLIPEQPEPSDWDEHNTLNAAQQGIKSTRP